MGKKVYYVHEQLLGKLPAAVGRNADIKHAILIIEADGVEVDRVTCEFNLETREPKGPVRWKSPAAASALEKLGFVDNSDHTSELAIHQLGEIKDGVAPSAPTDAAFGEIRQVDQVLVGDGQDGDPTGVIEGGDTAPPVEEAGGGGDETPGDSEPSDGGDNA